MLIKKTKRDGWEVIDLLLKNGTAASLYRGEPVSIDIVTAKDGSVITPTTATLRTFAGIVADTMGASNTYNDVRRVRAYGWHSYIYMGGTTVHPGAMMVPADGVSYMTLAVTISDANSTALDNANNDLAFVIAGTTSCAKATSTGTTTGEGFVRAWL